MKVQIAENFDQQLTEIYSSAVTVNLEATSQISPSEFWNSMEMIAMNHKAMINFKVR